MEKHVFWAHELPLRYKEAKVTKVKARTELIAAETAAKLADRPAVPQAAPTAWPSRSHASGTRTGGTKSRAPRWTRESTCPTGISSNLSGAGMWPGQGWRGRHWSCTRGRRVRSHSSGLFTMGVPEGRLTRRLS